MTRQQFNEQEARMSNIATTMEQSKHLLELGLSKESADMSYSEEYFGRDKDGNDEWCWKLNACKFVDIEGIVPAWSLSALLEVMPKETLPALEYREGNKEWEANVWIHHNIHCISHYDKMCAVYSMVCWLLENNLIKKG